MCGPLLMIAGAVVQGIGALKQAQNAKKNAQMQQDLANDQADQTEVAGAFQARQIMNQAARIGGQQRAAAAEGGLELSGSIEDVMFDSAAEADLDLQAIVWNTDASAKNLRKEGAIYGANARSAGASAPFAFLGPVLNTAARFPSAFGFA